jgi:hypothetical protein
MPTKKKPTRKSASKKPTKKQTQASTKKASSKKKASIKRSVKRSAKGSTGKSTSKRQESEIWLISPKTNQLIVENGKTYNDLLKAGVNLKKQPRYFIKAGGRPWSEVEPKGAERKALYAKHPNLFMLKPSSDLAREGYDPSLNQDEKPKYPIAGVDGVVNCRGVKAALRRANLDRLNKAHPARKAHVIDNIKHALDKYCSAG